MATTTYSSSFPFGQIRRQSNATYFEDFMSYTIEDYQNQPSGNSSQGIIFTDKAIVFTNAFNSTDYYYLRVLIDRQTSQQKFNVYLQNTINIAEPNISSQHIGTYIVPAKVSTNSQSSVEFIISPNANDYNCVIFQLQRTIKDDYSQVSGEEDGQTTQHIGRPTKIYLDYCGKFKNLLSENITCVKVGIQATPGSLFCIKGEGIRVGPSGIYQINNGYEVDFIGAAIRTGSYDPNGENPDMIDNYEYFTIDYRYKRKQQSEEG